jgi:hypothetical protein
MTVTVATFKRARSLEWLHRPRLGPLRPDPYRGGTPAEQEVRLTTCESKGDPRMINPEQLVVIAASSCQMLWFLHLAARPHIDVVEYDDAAVAFMPQGEGLQEIMLRPRIVLASGSEERAQAHPPCARAMQHRQQPSHACVDRAAHRTAELSVCARKLLSSSSSSPSRDRAPLIAR